MTDRIFLTGFRWPGDGSDVEREALQRALEAGAIDTLITLYTGDSTVLSVASETTEVFGYYLQYRIPLADVMRAVQSGEEVLTQLLVDEIVEHVEASSQIATVRELLPRLSSIYSFIASLVRMRYERESDRWTIHRNAMRIRTVQQLLDGSTGNNSHAIDELDYTIDQPHVMVVLQANAGGAHHLSASQLLAVARSITRVLGSAVEPFFVSQGESRAYFWVGSPAYSSASNALASERWPPGLRIAISGVHAGLAGFRETYAEAIAADRVARLSPSRQVTDYTKVELVSLLSGDLDRARAFVTRTIGALSSGEPRIVELRKTLAAYIDTSGGLAETAQRLHVHRNTISYRLQQIETVVGSGYDATAARIAIMLVEELPLLMDAVPPSTAPSMWAQEKT